MGDSEIVQALAAAEEHGRVTLTATDAVFISLLTNWIRGIQRVGIRAAAVWALDERTFRTVLPLVKSVSRGLQDGLRVSPIFSANVSLPRSLAGQHKLPGSATYIQAVSLKTLVCQHVLRYGFDLLFLDVDLGLAVWDSGRHARLLWCCAAQPRLVSRSPARSPARLPARSPSKLLRPPLTVQASPPIRAAGCRRQCREHRTHFLTGASRVHWHCLSTAPA